MFRRIRPSCELRLQFDHGVRYKVSESSLQELQAAEVSFIILRTQLLERFHRERSKYEAQKVILGPVIICFPYFCFHFLCLLQV